MATRWMGGLVLALGLASLGGACSAPHPAPPQAAPATPAAPPAAEPEIRHPVGLRLIELRRGRSRPLPTLLFYPAQDLTPGRPQAGSASTVTGGAGWAMGGAGWTAGGAGSTTGSAGSAPGSAGSPGSAGRTTGSLGSATGSAGSTGSAGWTTSSPGLVNGGAGSTNESDDSPADSTGFAGGGAARAAGWAEYVMPGAAWLPATRPSIPGLDALSAHSSTDLLPEKWMKNLQPLASITATAASTPAIRARVDQPFARVREGRPGTQAREGRAGRQAREARLGAQVREAQPGAQVSEAQPGAQVSKALPAAQVREAPPGSRVREAPPGSRVREARPVARVREGRPPAQAVDALLDTQLPGSGVGCRPARGRFPLVLFSHGMSGSPQRLAAALAGWAAAGFVVAAPAYPYTKEHTPDYRRADIVNQPDDLRLVLAKVRALDRTPADPLRGRIDVDRVAAIGHSAGGYTTSGLFVAGHDPRLRSAVIMSGWRAPGAFAGPPAKMLFLQGTADPVVPMAKSRAAYDRVPWPKRYLVLPRVSHANYLRPGDRGYPVMEKVVIDFLRQTLSTPPGRDRLATGP